MNPVFPVRPVCFTSQHSTIQRHNTNMSTADYERNERRNDTHMNVVDLTVELRTADGISTEYYQTDEERIQKTLRLLAEPQLLTRPQLVLASEQGVSTIPCRAIDMILARTTAQLPVVFPLKSPMGLLDIAECPAGQLDEESGTWSPLTVTDCGTPSNPLVSRVQIHTIGGWVISLKVLAVNQGTVHDQRQSFAHLFELPVISFRLALGGIGFINPKNITHVSGHPTPDALPNTALPMELLRWTARCQCSPTLAVQSREDV